MDFKFEVNESLWLPNVRNAYYVQQQRMREGLPTVSEAVLDAITYVYRKLSYPDGHGNALLTRANYYLSDVSLTDVAIMALLLVQEDCKADMVMQKFNPKSPEFRGQTPVARARELSDIVKDLRTTAQYQLLLNETEQYKTALESQWRGLAERVVPIMQDITRMDLDLEFTVYALHPSTTDGEYLGGKRIVFGAEEYYPNFGTIALCHEGMHDVLDPERFKPNAAHCIVMLAADNELRVRLNGGAYPPFEGGHLPELSSLMGVLFPFWKTYLSSSRSNIVDFTASLPFRGLEELRKTLSSSQS